jgi:hypothetical protein
MNTRSIRTAVSLTLLLAVLSGLFACDWGRKPDPPPGELQTNNPLNDPCRGNPANRLAAIRTYVNTNSMDDNLLNEQRRNGYFDFVVTESPVSQTDTNTWIQVRVRGGVVGVDNSNAPGGKTPKMTKFLRFLEGGMRKGCIDRVSFESMPEPNPSPVTSSTTTQDPPPDGFQWLESCPVDEIYCPRSGLCSTNGVCPLIPTSTPTPSPTLNP